MFSSRYPRTLSSSTMASSSAPLASSSKAKKSKTKVQTAEASVPPAKSQEIIEDDTSSSEEESEGDSDEDLDDPNTLVPRREDSAADAAAVQAAQALPNYQPPPGMVPANVTTAFKASPFEWDNMLAQAEKGTGIELWAVRVPQDLKTSRLSALSVTVPPASSSDPNPRVRGSLVTSSGKKHYKLSQASSSKASSAMDVDGDDKEEVEGGEEMKGLRLLVPRFRKGGKLFTAPIPITRHLLLAPTDAPEDSTRLNSGPAPPRPKRHQPTELLKFRNFPSGFHTVGPGGGVGKETDAANEAEEGMVNGGLHPAPISADKKVKKRKSLPATDGTPAKKTKKVKA